ncbi:thioesterase domain-containing protein [Streptomyces vinaceus]|uniref:thioesterase domain-containing protein n=1 Tax=Streptomyces vinaceus TaxID=1960 RepID=UPI003803827D
MPRRDHVVELVEGEGTPLFLLPWTSGGIAFVREFGAEFHHGHPVFGFEAPGLWRDEDFLTSVDDMADLYLREIKAIQPHGPYLLGGLCGGSQVAYALAARLAAAGDEVGPLTLVNAARGELAAEPLLELEDLYELRLAALRQQFAVTDLAADLPYVLAAMRHLRWIDQEMPVEDFFWRQALWAGGAYAHRRCRLPAYDGPVNVFVARSSAQDPEVRWHDLAPRSTLNVLHAETSAQIMTHPVFLASIRCSGPPPEWWTR